VPVAIVIGLWSQVFPRSTVCSSGPDILTEKIQHGPQLVARKLNGTVRIQIC
jgi:hypothetical protein